MSTPRAKSSPGSRRLADTLPMSQYQIRKSQSPRMSTPRAKSSPGSRRLAKSSSDEPSWLGDAARMVGVVSRSPRGNADNSGILNAAQRRQAQEPSRLKDIDPVRRRLSYSSRTPQPRAGTKRQSLIDRLSRKPSRKPKSSRGKPKRHVKSARPVVRNQRLNPADFPSAFAKADKLSHTPRAAPTKTLRNGRGRCKEKRCRKILQTGVRCKLCVKGNSEYCHIHRD